MEDCMELDLEEIGFVFVDCIHVTQRIQYWIVRLHKESESCPCAHKDGVEVHCHSFLTSVLDEEEWSASWLACFTP
jgi:hypothetical protein